ncbi:universal stress protein [Nocardioides seonyuensis]|uniref:Universal stress protein n=1 Tax=Nocardioides seonyuensis TaxID=2518371 RepID=A0A4P7IFC2_9ACTN|nr:universal stress protein [Nocardioides seonyuensis]QBX55964.1 universal stress protein [Nocardioides seonyuensis]
MTPRIVTGVDGSPTANEAATRAAVLASHTGAELHVVSAFGHIEERTVRAENVTVHLTPREDALRDAEATAELLRVQSPGISVIAASVEGRPAKALVSYAEEVEAELIVVGNKRVQGIARILGSIAADVAQKAHCDVYIAQTHGRG